MQPSLHFTSLTHWQWFNRGNLVTFGRTPLFFHAYHFLDELTETFWILFSSVIANGELKANQKPLRKILMSKKCRQELCKEFPKSKAGPRFFLCDTLLNLFPNIEQGWASGFHDKSRFLEQRCFWETLSFAARGREGDAPAHDGLLLMQPGAKSGP